MGEGGYFSQNCKILDFRWGSGGGGQTHFLMRVGRGYASCSLALKIKSQIKKKGILENYLSKY